MSEAAWNKAFTQGSSALKKRLMDVHAKNPKFQSWLKSSGHGAGQSVKQASKEVKSSERVKQLQAKSLKAYGATKGTRMGSADGSGEELKDTIKPLTRDQHSKVQAAARAAKKTPLTKDQRMAAIAASVRKYKEKHDVPTVDPDDEGHDDLRDIHQSLHIRKGYNEEVELDEASKAEAEKLLGGPVKTRTGNEPKGKLPLGFRRARNLARQAMKGGVSAIHRSMEKTMQKENVTESTTEVNEMSSHGKALAKAIMAKQSKHPIAQNMGEAVKDQADVGEYDYEGDMAKSQLRSILTNAKRLHDMLEDTTNLPEWVQSKITLAEDYILTAANYMEGEMNEEALAALAASLDEEIELFEKAPPGSKYERMVKHIKKGYAKGGLTDKERSIAYATAWKAHNKANEEVEQIDELKKSTLQSYAKKASKEMKKAHDYHQMRYGGRDGSDSEYMKKTYPAAVAKYDRRDAGVAKAKQKIAKEEVEQVEEKYENNPLHSMPRPNKAVGLKPSQLAKKPVTAEGADDWKKAFAKVAKRNLNQDTAQVKQKVKKLEPVDEAEGSVPTTPKEKELAAHHGDPNKITFGDVIKARLKSAAAKKMGK